MQTQFSCFVASLSPGIGVFRSLWSCSQICFFSAFLESTYTYRIPHIADEENMRHWSHHHSTDTVDDPIFRAAMRGCDSVSFVFGLEVTWSLIQQRQQEEEEAAAAELLEEMHTNGDLDDDKKETGDDGLEETKRSAVQNAVEESEGESSDESEDENSPTSPARSSSTVASNRHTPEVEASSDKEMEDEEMSSNSSSSDEDEDDSPVKNVSAEEDESSVLSSSEGEGVLDEEADDGEEKDKDDECHDHVTPSTPSQVSKKKAPRRAVLDSLATTGSSPSHTDNDDDDDTHTWQCEKCTIINDFSDRQCTMCHSAMPRSVRRSLSHSPSPHSSQ